MTRQPHDQFAKQYLGDLLTTLGEVETSRDVASEVRQVDLYFVPTNPPKTDPENLGLLGKMAASACLIEPFRNAPTPVEVRNCLLKLYAIHGETLRKARREKNSLTETDLPFLWILAPSSSSRLIKGFGAKLKAAENWPAGVYFLSEFYKTALVAINQIPSKESTLWLRLLGRGATQQQAVNELVSLPENHPLRANILEIVTNWRINVQMNQNLTNEDQELIMNLSPAYLHWRENTLQEGRLEGLQEGRLELVENFLQARFGLMDEELSHIIQPLLQLPPQELTSLLLNLSREELCARFGRELN